MRPSPLASIREFFSWPSSNSSISFWLRVFVSSTSPVWSTLNLSTLLSCREMVSWYSRFSSVQVAVLKDSPDWRARYFPLLCSSAGRILWFPLSSWRSWISPNPLTPTPSRDVEETIILLSVVLLTQAEWLLSSAGAMMLVLTFVPMTLSALRSVR